jgi:hypothetical protein
VRGIATPLHRSSKSWLKIKGTQEHLKLHVSKPPRSSSTRWGGIIPQFQWMGANRAALKRYIKDFPQGCAVNEDGSTFKDHSMSADEVDICFQLVIDVYFVPH